MRGQPYYRYSPLYFSFISRTLWFRQDSRHGSVRLQVQVKGILWEFCAKHIQHLTSFVGVRTWAYEASCEGLIYALSAHIAVGRPKEETDTFHWEDSGCGGVPPWYIQWGPSRPNLAKYTWVCFSQASLIRKNVLIETDSCMFDNVLHTFSGFFMWG